MTPTIDEKKHPILFALKKQMEAGATEFMLSPQQMFALRVELDEWPSSYRGAAAGAAPPRRYDPDSLSRRSWVGTLFGVPLYESEDASPVVTA